jgi:hypothetical protein
VAVRGPPPRQRRGPGRRQARVDEPGQTRRPRYPRAALRLADLGDDCAVRGSATARPAHPPHRRARDRVPDRRPARGAGHGRHCACRDRGGVPGDRCGGLPVSGPLRAPRLRRRQRGGGVGRDRLAGAAAVRAGGPPTDRVCVPAGRRGHCVPSSTARVRSKSSAERSARWDTSCARM